MNDGEVIYNRRGRLAKCEAGVWKLFERERITQEGHGVYRLVGMASHESEAREWVVFRSKPLA